MRPWLDDGDVQLVHADCVEAMRAMPEASVDAVVCDPPYGLGFMGAKWDTYSGETNRQPSTRHGFDHVGGNHNPVDSADSARTRRTEGRRYQAWCEAWAGEALRVLKPGGHLVAFGGTRTYHRLACAIEDAGFEVRDSLCWLYGSGFPKSLDVSKAIDKAAGAEREVLGMRPAVPGVAFTQSSPAATGKAELPITEPATAAAAAWEGWGTALKPAYEPIVLARRPLVGTVAANVQAHGTGALNIDGCRIKAGESWPADARPSDTENGYGPADSDGWDGNWTRRSGSHEAGRWPANVVLNEAAAAQLDEQSGNLTSNSGTPFTRNTDKFRTAYGEFKGADAEQGFYGDTGGASRFFYTAKASRSERGDENTHPTVKPVALMRWLCRLVTPPGGVILDPFCGSGTTPLAARLEGFRCIAVDREEEYLRIAARRTAQLSLLAEGGVA